MRNIWTIAKREYQLYFSSPAAYLIAFAILLFLGILFFLTIQVATQAQFVPTVDRITSPLAFLLFLATPVVTFNLLAGEHRMGTIELLLTAPVRDWELVVGKWLGAFLFMLSILFVTIIYPLIMHQMVDPGIDQGPFVSGYLGLMLLCAALVALGVMISSFFNNPIAAFIATLGVLIFFWWFIGIIAQVTGPTSGAYEFVNYMNLNDHFYSNLTRGVIDLRDITFFLSLTALSLFLGTVAVEMRRWR